MAYGVVNAGQLASACRAAFQGRQPTWSMSTLTPLQGGERECARIQCAQV